MPFAENIAAYPDCAAILDRALASEKGLRITFNTPEEATLNRGRMNAYRQRLRRENAKTYPADHLMHNTTPYEGLTLRLDGAVVVIEKLDNRALNIEEIK